MDLPDLDLRYLRETLSALLAAPSPTGCTADVSRVLCNRLETLGISCETDRRGTVTATLSGMEGTRSHAVTIAKKDASVPYDRGLTQKLLNLCTAHGIAHRRDVFRYYHSDARSALLAGHDVRVGLIGFGADASHGYERTHTDGLLATARLVAAYLVGTPV